MKEKLEINFAHCVVLRMNETIPSEIALMLDKLFKTIETFNSHDMLRCLLILLFLILNRHSFLSDDLIGVEKALECAQEYYHYVYECKLMAKKPLSYAHYMLKANNATTN